MSTPLEQRLAALQTAGLTGSLSDALYSFRYVQLANNELSGPLPMPNHSNHNTRLVIYRMLIYLFTNAMMVTNTAPSTYCPTC